MIVASTWTFCDIDHKKEVSCARNGNPTGPSGAFNGNITTGCSYDPLTGNATRTITDLVVAGGLGHYPLAFGRTANSRYQRDDDFAFGPSGGWRQSYAWDIDGSLPLLTASTQPTVYPVSFPDGRTVDFWASSSDIYFRGPPGVKERFQPLNFSTMRAYLILPDGGKIEFKATRHSECIPELHVAVPIPIPTKRRQFLIPSG